MNPIDNSGDEPPPEDEDRSLLFGSPKERTEPGRDRQKPGRARASALTPPPRTSPPAAETGAEPPDPAGRAGPVAPTEAASDAVQRRILALLENLGEKAARPASGETDLAAAARIIAGQAEQIGAATEWVNDIKAAVSEILASTGRQIDGLKSGRQDLDAALAQLNVLKEGLDKVVQSLDTTAKGLDRRSSELGAVKQELAGYYREWIAEARTGLGEMRALSKRLDAGDHMVTRLEKSIGPWTERMQESIGANSAAQRDAAAKTADNVDKLAMTGFRFLQEFGTARGGGAEGGPAGVDAHSALDASGAGNRAGDRRAAVRVCGRAWAERVRRIRPLRRHRGLEAGGVGASRPEGQGLHGQVLAGR